MKLYLVFKYGEEGLNYYGIFSSFEKALQAKQKIIENKMKDYKTSFIPSTDDKRDYKLYLQYFINIKEFILDEIKIGDDI